jgi:hypothetical protein
MAQYTNSLEYENNLSIKSKPRKIWPTLQIGNFEMQIHYNVAMKQINFVAGKRFFPGKFFRFKWFLG